MDPIFLERLHKVLDSKALEYFCKPLQKVSFRVNLIKTNISQIDASLKALGVSFEPVEGYPNVLSVPAVEARMVLDSRLVAEGLVYSQGLESISAVLELGPRPGEHVLDLCAAPGSKTSQIAALMNNEGLLVANEPIRDRFYRLKSVLSLTGAQAKLTMVDGRRYQAKETLFDRVLVDAPCSSEGRFKYDQPKTYAYWSLRKIKEMAHKQKGLLLNASRLIKPGGILVYSTCTFSAEENEEVVEWFMRKTQGVKLLSQRRILPDGRMEGFFIAKWQKI